MKRFSLCLILAAAFLVGGLAHAQTPDTSSPSADTSSSASTSDTGTSGEVNTALNVKTTYALGTIERVISENDHDISGFPVEDVSVKITDGPDANHVFDYEYQLPTTNVAQNRLNQGETVVVVKVSRPEGDDYYVGEKYRNPSVIYLVLFFLLITLSFGRIKGLTSLLGLAFSLMIIVWFILPQIVAGRDPVFISIVGSLMIVVVSLYLAHGFVKRTTVAMVGTLITLALAGIMAVVSVNVAKVFGLGSEDAVALLQSPQFYHLDLRGLLLGGIIIGLLGVLDDITTAQSATVDEIHRANPKLGFVELYKGGISVGREHIASLVNTLALAYVGVSLPLLLTVSKSDYPFWVIMNSEYVVEEIVRTLVGSLTLMLAVPITTALAAYVFAREKNPPPPDPEHAHHH